MDAALNKVAAAVEKAEPAVEKAVRDALGDKAGDAVHAASEKLNAALHDDVSVLPFFVSFFLLGARPSSSLFLSWRAWREIFPNLLRNQKEKRVRGESGAGGLLMGFANVSSSCPRVRKVSQCSPFPFFSLYLSIPIPNSPSTD